MAIGRSRYVRRAKVVVKVRVAVAVVVGDARRRAAARTERLASIVTAVVGLRLW